MTIIVKRYTTLISIELLNNKTLKNSEHKVFDTTLFDENMYEFITSYTKETPFYYVCVLDTSLEQGAIPTCSKNNMWNYSDLTNTEQICCNNQWTYYTAKSNLYNLEKKYSKIGIDFVFSPFILLYNFFSDKIETHKAMYILIEESCLSLSIFNSGELLYAEHIDMDRTKQSDEFALYEGETPEHSKHEQNTIDLDDIDTLDELESFDELEDFSSIEDLDNLDDMEDFAQEQDIEEEFNQINEAPVKQSDSSFNEDYQRFLLIQSSLNHFYKDTRYQSEFIENVYVADGVGVSHDLKRYLEEEMFLSVYVRHMDLVREICETAKLELK